MINLTAMIQLISQMKGYFHINGYLALSLAITIFSFAGIPPLLGFFAKQMVLSAALDSGYVFLALVAILTSVIGGVYYLGIIKQVFFDKSEYKKDQDALIRGHVIRVDDEIGSRSGENVKFKFMDIVLSSYLTITISILTLVIILFIFIPKELLNLANILALIL